MKMKARRTFLVTALAVFPLAACGSRAPGRTTPVAAPPGVEYETAALADVPLETVAVATLEARESASPSSRIMGRILSAEFEEGDAVEGGQVLVRIESEGLRAEEASARAALQEAEARQERARSDFQRFGELREKEAATVQEWEAAREGLHTTEARVEAARHAVDQVLADRAYAEVRAPFAGRVVGKFAKEGDLAVPGKPLFEVAGLGRLRAVAELGESAVQDISPGREALVEIGGAGGRIFQVHGSVEEVVPMADPVSRTSRVRIALADPPVEAVPGGYARVRLPRGTRRVLAVPAFSVVRRGGLEAVFVETPEGPTIRLVRTGPEVGGDRVEILSGLVEGERYAVAGLVALAAGSWEVRR